MKVSSAPTLPSSERKIDENFGVSRGRGAPRHSGLIVAQRCALEFRRRRRRRRRVRVQPVVVFSSSFDDGDDEKKKSSFLSRFLSTRSRLHPRAQPEVQQRCIRCTSGPYTRRGHFRDFFERSRVAFAYARRLRQLIGNFRT